MGTLTIWTETESGEPLDAPVRIYDVDQNNLLVASGYGTESNPWVVNLPPSHYLVNFISITGWNDPPSRDIWVTDNSQQTIIGVYTEGTSVTYAQINVNTTPIVGTILCDGSIYGYGSVPIIKFPPVEGQNYVISFLPEDGYNTPPPQTVRLYPGDTVNVTGTYVPRTGPSGFLTVITTLNNEAPAHTEVFLNGISIGHDVENLELDVGTYVVSFTPLSGWIKPANINVNIQEGQLTEIVGNYQIIIDMGILTVNTTPVSGAIMIDGQFLGNGYVQWQVSPGTHVVSFGDVPDYKKPSNITVTAISYEEVIVTGLYTSIVVPPPVDGEGGGFPWWLLALAGVGAVMLSKKRR